MADQEKPQGPKRRSSQSKASAKARAGHPVPTNGEARKPVRPVRHHVKGTASPERPGGAKPAPSQPSATEAKARGWVGAFSRYLKGVKTEFLRVAWPSKQDLKKATMVVCFTLFLITAYLFVVNLTFTALFSKL